MGQKGMDFKRKEVINIKDGKRLRFCSRCLCRPRKWNNNIHNCALIENRYIPFIFEREIKKNGYTTKKKQARTSYIIKEKFEYDVICKVEL